MKNTLKSVISFKQEGTKLEKDVVDIKKDIKLLLDENRETIAIIIALENELQEETDEEQD